MKIIKSIFVFFISIPFFGIGAQVAEIPFDYDKEQGHIFLKVKVKNKDSDYLSFVFDTGATADLIDINIANNLGIKPNYISEIEGASGTTNYHIALNEKLYLPDNVTIKSPRLVLSDLSQLNSASIKEVQGIIGYSLLSQHIVTIDYINKKILLYQKIDQIDLSGYKPIKFHFKNGITIPQFDISITLKNKNSYKGRVFLDSGAALTLLVNTPFDKKNDLTGQADKVMTNSSENLNGTSAVKKIAIKSLEFNGFKFENLPIEISSDNQGVSSFDNYLGILGSDIISRFNIVLDYKTMTLYLKPSTNYNSNFKFPLSGIQLKKIDNDIIINSIVEWSPAYKLGLRKGDKILSINNNYSSDILTYKKLLSKEGQNAIIEVINNEGTKKTVELNLNRII